MMSLDLPWPAQILFPNARPHRMARASAVKRSRADAAWAAKAAGIGRVDAVRGLLVTLTFSPPDKRHRDTDGMLGAMKAALDGIADVVGVDDSKWDFILRRSDPRPLGNVRIEIEPIFDPVQGA